jgi:DeoR/GlpR family transcriptional regulator of sugar metabolism
MRKRSKKRARQDRILSALGTNPAMRVNELAAKLEVSPETIRRDLAELDDSGQIRRTYGGALRNRTFEPSLTERIGLHVEARQRIAAEAVRLVAEAGVVFIGGGATTLHFARALHAIKQTISVVTPAFSIATELSSNPLIEVTSLPGLVEPKEGMVCGADTVDAIRRLRPPIAVLGASGVNEKGASEALMNAAQVYTAMIEAAERTLILADTSKFDRQALRVITPWHECVTLVCEAEPPKRLLNAITGGRANCVVAPPTPT